MFRTVRLPDWNAVIKSAHPASLKILTFIKKIKYVPSACNSTLGF